MTQDYRNFIDISDLSKEELRSILESAKTLKAATKKGKYSDVFVNKQLAMIFEKSSTRTRMSFEVGMNQLGGKALMLSSKESQLGRGETIADTAGVLSRYVDMIMIRTFKHETLKELAEKATVPVINGLTDYSHPCQIMTDILTFEEHVGPIEGKTVAWCGDYNNVAISWAQAAEKLGFYLRIATPEELAPPASDSKFVSYTDSAVEAATDADCITTDTWVSMGDTDAEYKLKILAPYQVNEELMRHAKEKAIFMHCMPAHREEEVTTSVIDGPQSVIFDEAENRLHAQKAIMLWCLNKQA